MKSKKEKIKEISNNKNISEIKNFISEEINSLLKNQVEINSNTFIKWLVKDMSHLTGYDIDLGNKVIESLSISIENDEWKILENKKLKDEIVEKFKLFKLVGYQKSGWVNHHDKDIKNIITSNDFSEKNKALMISDILEFESDLLNGEGKINFINVVREIIEQYAYPQKNKNFLIEELEKSISIGGEKYREEFNTNKNLDKYFREHLEENKDHQIILFDAYSSGNNYSDRFYKIVTEVDKIGYKDEAAANHTVDLIIKKIEKNIDTLNSEEDKKLLLNLKNYKEVRNFDNYQNKSLASNLVKFINEENTSQKSSMLKNNKDISRSIK